MGGQRLRRRPKACSRVTFAAALFLTACAGDDDATTGAARSTGTTRPSSSVTTANSDASTAGRSIPESPEDQVGPAGVLAGVDLTTDTDAELTELDIVRFGDVDTDALGAAVGDLRLVVEFGDAVPVEVPLRLDTEGVYAVLPLSRAAPGDGGTVRLHVKATDAASPSWELELAALTPAPGAWDEAVAAFGEALALRADAAGTSLSELASADPEMLAPDVLVLRLAAGYLDDGTDADIQSTADDLSPTARSLLDAIAAKVFSPSAVGELLSVPPPPLGLRAPQLHGFVRQSVDCVDTGLEIPDAQALETAIQFGTFAGADDAATEKLVADVETVAAWTGDIPRIGEVVSRVETLYAVMGVTFGAVAGTFPSALTSLTVEVSTERFNEDFDQPGAVTSAVVTAESTGFHPSEAFQTLTPIAVSAVSSRIGKDEIGGGGSGGDDPFDLTDQIGEKARDELQDAATSKLLEELGDRLPPVCAQSWDVDVADPDYIDLRAAIGRVEIDETALTYEPVMLGEDVLVVEVDPDRFSKRTAEARVDIDTLAIQVVASPPEVSVDRPGEEIDITAETANADDPARNWLIPHGSIVAATGAPDAPAESRTLTTATERGVYPYAIEIESASTTGLRTDDAPERFDTVWIRLSRLIVDPDPGQVAVDETLQFAATNRDGDPVDVTWEATGGTIGPDGAYRAGSEPGTYLVTATRTDDPSVAVTVTVKVTEATFCDELEQLLDDWLVNDSIGPADLTGRYAALAEVAPAELVAPLATLEQGNAILVATLSTDDLPPGYDSAGAQVASYANSECGISIE